MLESKLREIFLGLENAYGQTKVTKEIRADGKNEVRSYTVKNPVTNELWQKHLNGVEPALGIVPINENNQCKWGCIDIDTYPFDHLKFIKKVRSQKLPLIICRSKSGGAHVFLFTKIFVEASLMRNKLSRIAASLGYSKAEIFPKQSNIRADRGDIGNFLNMPYHGGDKSVRYAIDDNGNALTMEEFINQYDNYVLTEQELINIAVVDQKEEKLFPDGPPCLQAIIKEGPIVEGSADIEASGRDDGLFNIGVYVKKRFPNNWESKLEDYNTEKYLNPRVKATDVVRIIAQLDKKDYDYKCKQKPICHFCDEKVCFTRKYGKEGSSMPEITQIRKYDSDPPIYFVTVDDDTIEVDSATLHDPEKFSLACMDQINQPLLPVAKLVWRKMLSKLMKEMIEPIEAPDDARIDVQLKDALKEFVNRAPGKTFEDILKTKAYTEEGITYFKYKDFWKSLVKGKTWPEKTYPKLKTIRLLQELFKAKQDTKTINNKNVKVWMIENIELEKVLVRKNKKKKVPYE